MRLVVAAAIAMALVCAGCASTPEQKARQAEMDDAECQSWGLTTSDPRYAQCRALLMERTAQSEESIRKSIVTILANAGPPPAPTWQAPQRLQTMCTTSGVGGAVFTHCY